jgi:hypothetical protein
MRYAANSYTNALRLSTCNSIAAHCCTARAWCYQRNAEATAHSKNSIYTYCHHTLHNTDHALSVRLYKHSKADARVMLSHKIYQFYHTAMLVSASNVTQAVGSRVTAVVGMPHTASAQQTTCICLHTAVHGTYQCTAIPTAVSLPSESQTYDIKGSTSGHGVLLSTLIAAIASSVEHCTPQTAKQLNAIQHM